MSLAMKSAANPLLFPVLNSPWVLIMLSFMNAAISDIQT
jgi:hypothetical protein